MRRSWRDLQARGVQAANLTVRGVEGPGSDRVVSGYASLPRSDSQHSGSSGSQFVASVAVAARQRPWRGLVARRWAGGQQAGIAARVAGAGAQGVADAELMSLIRRLTFFTSRPGGLEGSAPRRADAAWRGPVGDVGRRRTATGLQRRHGAGRARRRHRRAARRRPDRPDGGQPDPRPPRRTAPGVERHARPHGDRRRRQPVRPDPLRLARAAADGAPDRAPAAAGAARRAQRPELLLVAQAPGAPLRQPDRLARLRVRRLRRRPGAPVPGARAASWCRRSSRATSTRSRSTPPS